MQPYIWKHWQTFCHLPNTNHKQSHNESVEFVSRSVTLLAMAADAPVMPPAAATPTPTAVRASEAPSVNGDRITPAAAATPPATVVALPVMPAIFVPFETFKGNASGIVFKHGKSIGTYSWCSVMTEYSYLIGLKETMTDSLNEPSQKWLKFWLCLDWLDAISLSHLASLPCLSCRQCRASQQFVPSGRRHV